LEERDQGMCLEVARFHRRERSGLGGRREGGKTVGRKAETH